ncbi:MAG: urate hydroxylase PuuD [Proteobacteria bacterium]|nr:urate hydroxylase PuuD [Pseudomonadota bacterium]MCH8895124.1 urate hydroxylase PuuD [Pseudomonadota bacterium]
MNPLKTVNGTLIAGFVLMLIIGASVGGFAFDWNQFVRWLHIIAGVTWIGLLYYFNFVQVAALGAAASDEGGPGGAAITKYVAPLALNWFRWAALVTWLSGAAYLGKNFVPTFTLGMSEGSSYYTILGLGAWMGTIMLFNVWVLIWPNQKKLLGMVPATDEEKAKAKSIAFMASRTNTLLSLPMLMCMTGAVHGLPF